MNDAERRAECVKVLSRYALLEALSLLVCWAFVLVAVQPVDALVLVALGLPLTVLMVIGATGVALLLMNVSGFPITGTKREIAGEIVRSSIKTLRIK